MKELTIPETTESTCFLSLSAFTRDKSNNITIKLYDKRDAFGFHIVNFPFMSSNIPSQGCHFPDNMKFPDFSLTIPDQD